MRRDGETLAELYERFGKADEIPDPPEVPDCVVHVLDWFFALSRRRTPGFSGVSPITFRDIADWRSLCGVLVHAFEVQMILDMDDAYRAAANETKQKEKPSEAPPPKGYLSKS